MYTDDDVSKSIENVVQIIRSVKCSTEDKVDAYLTLVRYFQTNKDVFVACVGKNAKSLFILVQKYLNIDDRSLIEATLTFLGHMLSVEELVRECGDSVLANLAKELFEVVKRSSEKSVVIRTLWCFSHQVLPEKIMNIHVGPLVESILHLKNNRDLKSETVNNEALHTLERLCVQCSGEMKKYVEQFAPFVFTFLTTEIAKNREGALNLLNSALDILLERQKFMQTFLLDQLNTKDLCANLNALFHNNIAPVDALNTWTCILNLLGEMFFELNRVKVTNPLLKIAEKSFGSKVQDVTLALNNMWRALIDVVFTRPDEFEKRMEKIFLLPIKIRYKSELIAQHSLQTQWHLLCKIGPKINDYVEKALNPLLDVYLKPNEPSLSVMSTSPANNPSTSIHSNIKKSVQIPISPRMPKSPHVVPAKVKILAAEILTQLLTESKDRTTTLKSLKLELFTGSSICTDQIIKNCKKYTNYIMNVTETCGMKHETAVSQMWFSFLVKLRKISESVTPTIKTIWTPVLLAVNEIIDKWMASCVLPLKILVLVPENVLKMSITEINISKDIEENGSLMRNADGLVSLFMVKLLLHKNSLEKEAFDQERYFIIYERAIGLMFSSLSDQLKNVNLVFDYLKQANSDIKIQDVRWRLWSTLTSHLSTYITNTNDVNQTNGANDYNFQASINSLTYPLKFIDLSKLSEGTKNEMLSVWTEIFGSFSRAVSLLSGVEINLAVEHLFREIKDIISSNITDSKSLQTLVSMVVVAVKSIDHSDLNKIFNAIHLSPNKLSKKFTNPLGNLTSIMEVMKLSMIKCLELNPKEGKIVDIIFTELLDTVELFFTQVQSGSILIDSLCHLSTPLLSLLDNNVCSKFSSKVTVKSEKVYIQIFTAVESNTNVLFQNELLRKLEPFIIKAISSQRKPLRIRSGKFWNSTFGKSTNLEYSNELQLALTNQQNKLNLVIPKSTKEKYDLATQSFSVSTMDETTQFGAKEALLFDKILPPPKLNTRTAGTSSPVKIRRSSINSATLQHKFHVSPQEILGNFMASAFKRNSPKSPYKNSAKQSAMVVRRKLPVGLNRDDSCEFVEIRESPATKNKRILTEHQKDRLRERKEIPVMYNNLDQSQDMFARSLSQDLTQTMDMISQGSTMDNANNASETINGTTVENIFEKPKQNDIEYINRRAFTTDVKKDVLLGENDLAIDENDGNSTDQIPQDKKINIDNEDDKSMDLIQSSLTQEVDYSEKRKKRASLLLSQRKNKAKSHDTHDSEDTAKLESTTNEAEDTAGILENQVLLNITTEIQNAVPRSSKESEDNTSPEIFSKNGNKKNRTEEIGGSRGNSPTIGFNREAKIIIGKLPTARRKRKRISMPPKSSKVTTDKKRKVTAGPMISPKETKREKKDLNESNTKESEKPVENDENIEIEMEVNITKLTPEGTDEVQSNIIQSVQAESKTRIFDFKEDPSYSTKSPSSVANKEQSNNIRSKRKSRKPVKNLVKKNTNNRRKSTGQIKQKQEGNLEAASKSSMGRRTLNNRTTMEFQILEKDEPASDLNTATLTNTTSSIQTATYTTTTDKELTTKAKDTGPTVKPSITNDQQKLNSPQKSHSPSITKLPVPVVNMDENKLHLSANLMMKEDESNSREVIPEGEECCITDLVLQEKFNKEAHKKLDKGGVKKNNVIHCITGNRLKNSKDNKDVEKKNADIIIKGRENNTVDNKESKSLSSTQIKSKALSLQKHNESSPVSSKLFVKNPFVKYTVSSPANLMTAKTFNNVPSPLSSPASGILKKKLVSGPLDSPSPPPKKRRVSFQLPSGAIVLPEIQVLTETNGNTEEKPFTLVRKRNLKGAKKRNSITPNISTTNTKPVYPDLVTCTTSIDKILPSLTFSRGVGHLVRAQNILTVGDLCALSENQIEALPIRSPKVTTLRSVLKFFSYNMTREKPISKSPLIIGHPNDDSFMDSNTPTKDETSLLEEAALLLTPSRHSEPISSVKPTSLFLTKDSMGTTHDMESVTEEDANILNTTPDLSPIVNGHISNKGPAKENNKPNKFANTESKGKELFEEARKDKEHKIFRRTESESPLSPLRTKFLSQARKPSEENSQIPPIKPTVTTISKTTSSTNTTDILEVELAVESQTDISCKETEKNIERNVSVDFGCQAMIDEVTGENNDSSHYIATMEKLSQNFQVDKMSIMDLFDAINKLDQMKNQAMEALRDRMPSEK